MKQFNEGDWVVLKSPSEYERTMFGDRLTFTVERSVEISGGEALYLAGFGQLGFWADRFDIIDEDPRGAK